MGSLFSKIFLSFWIAALLLGVALSGAERLLAVNAVDVAAHYLDAHVETTATLLATEGLPAVQRWLSGREVRGEHMPLVLLGADYLPLPSQNIPPHLREHLTQGFTPGIHPLHPHVFIVVRSVPNSNPAIYLAAFVRVRPFEHTLSPSLLAVMAIGVSGVVCLALAALLTHPVRRLRQATQALAAGDLTVRVGGRGHDEVAALGRDFDTMADRVRDLLEAQRRLLRDVSHELRSPLARLRVALDLAQRKEDAAPALARIAQEADRLESLVGSVLTLARLEEGWAHHQRQAVPLSELLQSIAQDALFEAETKGKGVTLTIQQPATVIGDPILLRAAIENVVRNGVRHTAVGTTVEMTLDRDAASGMVQLEVCDHGAGVPEEEIERIFQPFTRVGDARDRNSGGYGLGLAISRQAVAIHGGTIAAANVANGGLRVTLCFPD